VDFCFRSPATERTRALGFGLAQAILEQAASELVTLGLVGDLGAGKTLFVRGLAGGLGFDESQVGSPTFGLIHEYAGGKRPLAHVDLYRIDSEDELEGTGFVDLLVPATVVAVEWADRMPSALPSDRLVVELQRDPADELARRGKASAHGAVSARVLESWRAEIERAVS